ncbi:hypothetical protein GNI_117880 [Gregarina niphandrodes]|uniref:Uncharacterized protein n=1 Tax=Gregarina niphandrodes TaxID=110365 RepID=A0A023B2R7_GRENI|nr:hypothetical protein GNI_117880 [Gregarina niphandrodes]EZG55114.1 hypothetical protein GNI_117880 [Gregarina niphandrodes]|eukprot:XP_011131776.1 hypothetical protein GNI_117880 [Gregarina niphandrodes]
MGRVVGSVFQSEGVHKWEDQDDLRLKEEGVERKRTSEASTGIYDATLSDTHTGYAERILQRTKRDSVDGVREHWNEVQSENATGNVNEIATGNVEPYRKEPEQPVQWQQHKTSDSRVPNNKIEEHEVQENGIGKTVRGRTQKGGAVSGRRVLSELTSAVPLRATTGVEQSAEEVEKPASESGPGAGASSERLLARISSTGPVRRQVECEVHESVSALTEGSSHGPATVPEGPFCLAPQLIASDRTNNSATNNSATNYSADNSSAVNSSAVNSAGPMKRSSPAVSSTPTESCNLTSQGLRSTDGLRSTEGLRTTDGLRSTDGFSSDLTGGDHPLASGKYSLRDRKESSRESGRGDGRGHGVEYVSELTTAGEIAQEENVYVAGWTNGPLSGEVSVSAVQDSRGVRETIIIQGSVSLKECIGGCEEVGEVSSSDGMGTNRMSSGSGGVPTRSPNLSALDLTEALDTTGGSPSDPSFDLHLPSDPSNPDMYPLGSDFSPLLDEPNSRRNGSVVVPIPLSPTAPESRKQSSLPTNLPINGLPVDHSPIDDSPIDDSPIDDLPIDDLPINGLISPQRDCRTTEEPTSQLPTTQLSVEKGKTPTIPSMGLVNFVQLDELLLRLKETLSLCLESPDLGTTQRLRASTPLPTSNLSGIIELVSQYEPGAEYIDHLKDLETKGGWYTLLGCMTEFWRVARFRCNSGLGDSVHFVPMMKDICRCLDNRRTAIAKCAISIIEELFHHSCAATVSAHSCYNSLIKQGCLTLSYLQKRVTFTCCGACLLKMANHNNLFMVKLAEAALDHIMANGDVLSMLKAFNAALQKAATDKQKIQVLRSFTNYARRQEAFAEDPATQTEWLRAKNHTSKVIFPRVPHPCAPC